MFEKFLNNGTNTFHQRYNNTYGTWVDNVNKIRKLVKITEIAEDSGILTFVDSNGIKSTLYADSQDDIGFEFVPPIRRWYPHDIYGAVLGYRVAAHQFRRGLHDDNYRVVCLAKTLTQSPIPLNFALLNQMLYPNDNLKPSLDGFLDFISAENKTNTFYLSPQLVLQKTSATLLSILVYDRPVATGRYLKGRKVFSLTEVNPMFINDCKKLPDYISGLSLEVA